MLVLYQLLQEAPEEVHLQTIVIQKGFELKDDGQTYYELSIRKFAPAGYYNACTLWRSKQSGNVVKRGTIMRSSTS